MEGGTGIKQEPQEGRVASLEAVKRSRLIAKRAEVKRLEQLLLAAGLQLRVPPPRETLDHETTDVTEKASQQVRDSLPSYKYTCHYFFRFQQFCVNVV